MMLVIWAQAGGGGQADNVFFSAGEVLSPYIGVFYAAFVIAFIATPIMRALATRNGIVDWPDLKRKAHVEPVAYLGGVAVFLGWVTGVFVSFFITPHTITAPAGPQSVHFPISILFGATVITLVGLIDDVYGISPRVKVGGQLLAAAALASEKVGTELVGGMLASLSTFLGIGLASPAGGPEVANPAYWLSAVLVVIFVLGGCNAANLLDGLDGLASGVTGIVAAGFLFIAAALAMGLYGEGGAYSLLQDPVRIVICLALLGAVLGFLPYNFNPANIFMGDAGSMLLGYLSVSIILLFAERGHLTLVLAALIVFALPITDTSLAIVRRKMRGKPIFSPDNQHLHHQLIRSGLTVKQAVLLLYLLAIGFAILGCSMIFISMRFVAAVFLVLFGFLVVTAYKVGHRQHLAIEAAKSGQAETPAGRKSPVPQAPVNNGEADDVIPAKPEVSDTSSPDTHDGQAETT